MTKLNVAVVGCGNISDIYLKNLTTLFNEKINVYAVCDLNLENAKKASEKYNISKIMTLDEILSDNNIDVVLNLTTPGSHYSICKKILESKKHVYVEKPLALSYKDGKELIEIAKRENRLIGCAPDTFMGAGIATCIEIINKGLIGDVIGATAFVVSHGPECWHPNPEFFYKKGAGPMFDLGPYYLTALVSMIGNVKSVFGMTLIGNKTRTATCSEKFGQKIAVEIPTHINGLLRFENGAVGNIITSFDVWGSSLPKLEVHGTKGSIIVPDPNTFGGEVKLKKAEDMEFSNYPLVSDNTDNLRGMGLSNMVDYILGDTEIFKASGEKALHVLEIMEAIHKSNDIGTIVDINSRC